MYQQPNSTLRGGRLERVLGQGGFGFVSGYTHDITRICDR